MNTKIATIEVTTCLLCPFFRNDIGYCNKTDVYFDPLNALNIAMNDNIPVFCTLPQKIDKQEIKT
mgnify:FL=1